MMAETSLLPTEPSTHTQGNRWKQKIFCDDYSLTHQELQSFYSLKDEANILFDQNQRWDLIKMLYTEYFQEPAKTEGKEWMRLGFQGKYPETDFRGGGVLSLQLILRFVRRNKQLVQKMEIDKAGFFFAITAINIAFFMKKYFHLAEFLVPIQDANIYCKRRALKNFCRILVDNEQAYFEMHDIFLRYFYNQLWVKAQTRNSQTLLQFNKLFQTLTNLIKRVFQRGTLRVLKDFFDSWHSHTI